MDRTERYNVLMMTPPERLYAMAETLTDGELGEIQLMTPPTVGMVMARAEDGAKNEVFNLGEVLVTEARVSIAGQEGWGMVMGSDPDQALAVAIVDAALAAGHSRSASIDAELTQIAATAAAALAAELAEIAPTRVIFDNF